MFRKSALYGTPFCVNEKGLAWLGKGWRKVSECESCGKFVRINDTLWYEFDTRKEIVYQEEKGLRKAFFEKENARILMEEAAFDLRSEQINKDAYARKIVEVRTKAERIKKKEARERHLRNAEKIKQELETRIEETQQKIPRLQVELMEVSEEYETALTAYNRLLEAEQKKSKKRKVSSLSLQAWTEKIWQETYLVFDPSLWWLFFIVCGGFWINAEMLALLNKVIVCGGVLDLEALFESWILLGAPLMEDFSRWIICGGMDVPQLIPLIL